MNFVDYDVAQTAENAENIRSAVDKHTFKRFRRYLENSLRVVEHFFLVTLRNVAVPMKNGQAGIEKKCVDTLKLVVYKAFEGRYIKHADRHRRIFRKLCDNREERRFRFAGGCVRGEDEVVVASENDICRRNLRRAELLPAACVYIIPNEGTVAGENFFACHKYLLLYQIPTREAGWDLCSDFFIILRW